MHTLAADSYDFPACSPGWQSASQRRLGLSMIIAALLVWLAMLFLHWPRISELPPAFELVVDLVRPEPPTENVAPLPDAPVAPAVEPPAAAIADQPSPPAAVQPEEGEAPQPIDWEAAANQAVLAAVDAALEPAVASMNAFQAEKRRQAAIDFRPSEAPVKKPIWENVEKDQIGRTVLRSGNCYKVLDDPWLTNRWAFETFGQYMTYCDGSNEVFLIEFDEIAGRYDYLDNDPLLNSPPR